MSEISPSTDPVPPARRRALPWWLPGLAVGCAAAACLFPVAARADARDGTHRARAWVVLRSASGTEPPPPTVVQQWRFHLRSPDLLTRVVADPAVAQLATIKAWDDPVAELERRLAVEEAAPVVLEVALVGRAPEDLKIILDHLVKRFVSDATAIDNRTRDDQLTSLEKLRTSLQLEIELQEKAIELQSRSGGVTGVESAATGLALLQKRLTDTETLLLAANRDLDKLEAERKVLRKQQEEREKNLKEPPPDAAPGGARRQARLAELDTLIAIKQEERESLRRERDAVRKATDNMAGVGVNIEAMRKALEPQREVLAKLQTQLIQQRLVGDRASASPRGAVAVEPLERPSRLPWAALLAAAGFAAGFVLATGFQLTGLVFRILNRRA